MTQWKSKSSPAAWVCLAVFFTPFLATGTRPQTQSMAGDRKSNESFAENPFFGESENLLESTLVGTPVATLDSQDDVTMENSTGAQSSLDESNTTDSSNDDDFKVNSTDLDIVGNIAPNQTSDDDEIPESSAPSTSDEDLLEQRQGLINSGTVSGVSGF